MRIRIAIVEAVLWIVAVVGLVAGGVIFALVAMAQREAGGGPTNGVEAVGRFTVALYTASPALILGTLALVGAGVMGAIERHRLTVVELDDLRRMQRSVTSATR